MNYSTAAAFRRALEDRLKSRAGGDGSRIARDRKRVAFDRLLARLVAVAPDRWLLKGGYALDLRLPGRARATKDIDLDWHDNDAELLDTLIEAATYDAGDFFVFSIERTNMPRDLLAGAHRFRIAVALAGRPFEIFMLDVGHRRTPVDVIDTLTTSDLLAFAGIESLAVRSVPLVLQIAEKLHAYTQVHAGGRISSRVKDLVDLVLIAELSGVDAHTLRVAIEETFMNRGVQRQPSALPPPPIAWRTPYRQLATAVGIAPELDVGYAVAAALLDPVLSGRLIYETWDPSAQVWLTGRTSS